MNKGLSLLVGFVFAAAIAMPPSPAAGEEGEAKAVKVKPEKAKGEEDGPFAGKGGKEGGKRVAFGDNIDEINATCQLTEDQTNKLRSLKESRDKDVEKYDKAAEPKLAKVQDRLQQLSGMDAKKDRRVADARKELEGMLHALHAGREQLLDGYEAKMFAVLTADQRGKWNGPILKDELMKKFSLVFLEGKQEERIEAFCQTQAKRLTAPLDPARHEKGIEPLEVQVYKNILTAKQQEEYRKIKAATAVKRG